MQVKIIGCGGIGGHLAPNLCHFLHAERVAAHVTLVDGDAYEARNRTRMRFDRLENKARVTAQTLAEAFGDLLTVAPFPHYLNATNVATVIGETDLVFLAVDNHATRRLVDAHCTRLRDVTLISGGNDGVADGEDGTYGTVQIVVRMDGRSVTSSLGRFHPEIAEPADHVPGELGCAALAEAGAPQLLFTNLAVASAMLNAFYAWRCGRITYEEVYLDIVKNRVVPVARAV